MTEASELAGLISSAEAVPASGWVAGVSASFPARYSRVVPGSSGGGPMIPPSTKRPPISRAVAGETAFAST